MRKGRRCILALAAIVAGCVILLALVLPGQVWWFLLAAGLIGLGIWMMRC